MRSEGEMKASEKKQNIILSAANRNGIRTITDLANRTGIPKTTLHRRMENPGTLTITEIMLINRKVRFSEEELKELVT